MSKSATKGFDPELIRIIEQWKKCGHTELAIVCQALYTLTQHADCPQWVRDGAFAIVRDSRP